MAKVLVFQHVAYEPLGMLDPMLREAKHRIKYVNFYRHPTAQPSLKGYQALIVLGGPMNVDEIKNHPHLQTEVNVIKEAIKKDIPILGICLGAQLIAYALGSDVYTANGLEVGWYDLEKNAEGRKDKVIKHFKETEKLFQWHGRTYDTPQGAVNLLSSKQCKNQAFRYGDKVYGLQFHLEVTEPVIMRWLHLDAHAEDLKMCGKYENLQEEIDETQKHIFSSMRLAKDVFGEFIKLIPSVKKMTSLKSRG